MSSKCDVYTSWIKYNFSFCFALSLSLIFFIFFCIQQTVLQKTWCTNSLLSTSLHHSIRNTYNTDSVSEYCQNSRAVFQIENLFYFIFVFENYLSGDSKFLEKYAESSHNKLNCSAKIPHQQISTKSSFFLIFLLFFCFISLPLFFTNYFRFS